MTIEEGREMIGTGMVLGIGAAVAASPCTLGAGGALLEVFDDRRQPARMPGSFRKRREAAECGAGVLRIARTRALA
jgi:hypothetical protein